MHHSAGNLRTSVPDLKALRFPAHVQGADTLSGTETPLRPGTARVLGAWGEGVRGGGLNAARFERLE